MLCCTIFGFLPVSATNYSAPADGKAYRLWNTNYAGHLMYEDQATSQLKTTATVNDNDFYQVFVLTKSGEGYTLRNVGSGAYVGTVYENEIMYTTGNNPFTFNIKRNTARTDVECYNLMHSTGRFCMHEAQGQRVVRWFPTTTSESNRPSEWQFEEVTLTPEMQQRLNEKQQLIPAAYYIINTQRKPGTELYMYEGSDHKLNIRSNKPSSTKFDDIWVMRVINGQSILQNLGTGRYVQKQSTKYTNYYTGANPYAFWFKRFGFVNGNTYWDIANTNDNNEGLHGDGDLRVVPWSPAAPGGQITPSEWVIREAGISNDQVKQRLTQLSGAKRPEDGKYYRIVCVDYKRPLKIDYANGTVTTENTSIANDYAQVWKLVAKDDRFDLVNAYTNQMIQRQSGALSKPYRTAASSNGGFKFSEVNDPFNLMFTMDDVFGVGIHCAQSQGYQAVGWHTSASANNWVLYEVKVDEEKLRKAQEEYQAFHNLKDNANVHWQKLSKYFDDAAATKIAPAYADKTNDNLKTEMQNDGIPVILQNVVLKIKDQAWATYASGNNWEERFRIASYKPYSDNDHWAWKVGMSYKFGNLTNPTGITAYPKNTLLLFVDSDVPANATLEAETVELCSVEGNRISLKKGLNVIAVEKQANLFVRYIVNTHNSGMKLAQFPDIKIHIEGGSVNGYFDLTKGDDNQVWKDLISDGLLQAKAVNLKTKNVVFHMNAAKVKAACPGPMANLLKIWDAIVQMEVDLKGLQAKVTDRCNNVLNATSVQSSYMYATTFGSYYEEGTLSSVMNYESMRLGGSIWGPAHEMGHCHQNLINMHGCTEVSNNLFSNVAVFNQGVMTSRGNGSSQFISEQYVAGNHFADYNIWCKTQLYFKLWLYFHAAGNQPDFYQKLFQLLNDDPMKKPYDINGPDEWLKFALKCCEAANADLSELFQMYGFFVPVHQKVVGDYSEKRLTATQAQIDAVLAKMHAYPKKLGNIVFIDDHIRRSPATYEGAPAGTMRRDYDDWVAIGKMGDHGQWEDFKPSAQQPGGARLLQCVKNNDGTMSIAFDHVLPGTMGYKFYDTKGNLLFIANTDRVQLPSSVVNKLGGEQPVIKVAQASGLDALVTTAIPSGIEAIRNLPTNAMVDVHTLDGVCVARHITIAQANSQLPQGVYIITQLDTKVSHTVHMGR